MFLYVFKKARASLKVFSEFYNHYKVDGGYKVFIEERETFRQSWSFEVCGSSVEVKRLLQ